MVGNILRLMLWRGLSIIRWNNFPRVVDTKHMDNVGFTLHVALYLAYLEDGGHKSTEAIDRLYLIKKIIFTSLADLILSDINSGTKGYIKKLDSSIFDQVYAKAFYYIGDFPWPEFLHDDMQNTIADKSHLREDQIFLAAKKYVGFVEASTNARVFPEMYEVPLREIETSLRDMKLESLQKLLSDPESQKFLAHTQRLSSSMRWNQYQRNTPISVMSHKVIVTYLTYVIGFYGNSVWEDNDIVEMLLRAIYHDVPEVITGDIITPTKKSVPWFQELLEKVETQMVDDYLFSYVSDDFRDYISPYMLHPFDGELGKKVKYADILSALFEAKIEDMSGNKNFWEVSKKLTKEMMSIDTPSVAFIMKDMVYFEDIWEDIIQ